MNKQQPGELLARGGTADVYAWGEAHILKLYHDQFPEETIRLEAWLAKAVYQAGISTPQAGDMISINGRMGLVYERINAPSMMGDLAKRPWTLGSSARLLANLHITMHEQESQAALPNQHQRLREKLHQASGLPEYLREKALQALARLPSGNRICHGDFHPGNVMLTPAGAFTIDWLDASIGNPLADVARTVVLLNGVGLETSPAIGWIVRRYCQKYLKQYFQQKPGGEDEVKAWYPVVAAARMSENIQPLQNWLLKQAEIGLT